MKPSSASLHSRLSTNSFSPSGETAFHEDDANPPRRHTPNNSNNAKSPRSVRFVAPANDDNSDDDADRDGRSSTSISPSGSFIGADHGDDDLLAHVASPSQQQEELPPFHLTREDVKAAFEFLDVNGSGILTMSNLKQRLSAFYPQLTSKEYKFLVEDPSGNNAVSAGGGSAALPWAAPPPAAPRALTSPLAAEGPKPVGGTNGDVLASSPGELATGQGGSPGSRAYGSRAGLDMDQLWDLIHSFQQLQSNIGSGGVSGMEAVPANVHRHAVGSSSGSRRHGAISGASSPPYDMNAAASLMQCEAGFDAVGEAFRVYDPRNTHYVEKEVLSRIMAQIGFGELNEEDLTLLVGTADFDGDGRISLDDFRRLVNMKERFTKRTGEVRGR
jgi:Ca2+-binding EF-hand superfamily protein